MSSPLPPLLKLLQQTEPGLLYYLASKPHLLRGTEYCNGNIVSRSQWSDSAQTVLQLFCSDGAQTTFSTAEQPVPHCDCHDWTKHSQCPHVVALWIQLKRLVSPKSFSQITIDGWVLRDLGDVIGLSATAPDGEMAGTRDRLIASLGSKGRLGTLSGSLPVSLKNIRHLVASIVEEKAIRFVLQERYGRLRGAFRRGPDEIQRWTKDVPRAVLHHVQRFPFFEASIRHLSSVMEFTGGKYPIVFRNESGREAPLTLSPDSPMRACLAFALDHDRVTIARTVNGSEALPEHIVIADELLLNLDGGTIHPLSNRSVWSVWDTLRESLFGRDESVIGNDVDAGFDEDEPGDESEDGFFSDESQTLGNNRIRTSAARFNDLSVRLNPGMITGFVESVFFYHGSAAIDSTLRVQPSYNLKLESLSDAPLIRLAPVVAFDDRSYPFSNDLFCYFDAQCRTHLSAPLKAKKRVRGIAEACFELANAATPAARKGVVKTALSGPDYIKRSVKNDARQVLNSFADELLKKPLMIQAMHDGWRFAEDNRMSQVRLMAILYELFGTELLELWERPGEMVFDQKDVLGVLPLLTGRLRQEGFELDLDGKPLSAAVWDFTLDATSSSLDWFELRPEIRCDGELVSGDELQQLAEGGILLRGGRLILIDDMSAQILAMLAGVVSQSKRKKKGAQQIARIPRLQILDWLQMRKHGVTVRLAPQDATVLESLLSFETVPHRPLPPGLIATLRPYQRDGYHWLAFLYEHRFGACLADDMGLGKTVQGISLLSGLADGTIADGAEPHTPHLIVVPPSLLFNWESEIARFYPAASVMTYSGPGRSSNDFNRFDIILTSYGIIQRDIEKLAAFRFNVIIFDEAQLVKNLQAATTSAARRLVGVFKLALTGTPVENRIEEYYAIMDLCLPGLLGTPEQFRNTVASRGQVGIDVLLRRTRPFVLRRNKQLIAAELPDKIETDIHLDLSPRQKALYQRTIEEVRGQIDEAFSSRAPGQARIIALTALLRLRQICLAPSLALAGAPDSSPKLDFLVEQLAELRDEGHSVLVFSQFTSYLTIVEAGLKRHHFTCLRLDGSTPTPQRKQLVQRFQNSDTPLVFLISLKAGGKGLNLTRATYVYHLDPWWNPAVENQASDRAHRIGQTRRVTITRLVMRHTIEEKMMVLKEQKQKLYRAILEDGVEGGGGGLSREDFNFLLG
ncbi:MAG: DEAD/DEAH box helicase [Desulfuromonadales bacterium]|nr:DEAD/DEAH box helicase [Desulfuromonadales bacterium]